MPATWETTASLMVVLPRSVRSGLRCCRRSSVVSLTSCLLPSPVFIERPGYMLGCAACSKRSTRLPQDQTKEGRSPYMCERESKDPGPARTSGDSHDYGATALSICDTPIQVALLSLHLTPEQPPPANRTPLPLPSPESVTLAYYPTSHLRSDEY